MAGTRMRCPRILPASNLLSGISLISSRGVSVSVVRRTKLLAAASQELDRAAPGALKPIQKALIQTQKAMHTKGGVVTETGRTFDENLQNEDWLDSGLEEVVVHVTSDDSKASTIPYLSSDMRASSILLSPPLSLESETSEINQEQQSTASRVHIITGACLSNASVLARLAAAACPVTSKTNQPYSLPPFTPPSTSLSTDAKLSAAHNRRFNSLLRAAVPPELLGEACQGVAQNCLLGLAEGTSSCTRTSAATNSFTHALDTDVDSVTPDEVERFRTLHLWCVLGQYDRLLMLIAFAGLNHQQRCVPTPPDLPSRCAWVAEQMKHSGHPFVLPWKEIVSNPFRFLRCDTKQTLQNHNDMESVVAGLHSLESHARPTAEWLQQVVESVRQTYFNHQGQNAQPVITRMTAPGEPCLDSKNALLSFCSPIISQLCKRLDQAVKDARKALAQELAAHADRPAIEERQLQLVSVTFPDGEEIIGVKVDPQFRQVFQAEQEEVIKQRIACTRFQTSSIGNIDGLQFDPNSELSSDRSAQRGTDFLGSLEQQSITSEVEDEILDPEFEVEKILASEIRDDGNEYFRLKWIGYDDPTWEVSYNCIGCNDLIAEFRQEQQRK